MKKRYLGLLSLSALALFTACEDTGADDSNNDNTEETAVSENETEDASSSEEGVEGFIEIRGSDTMVNLGQAFAEEYMDQNLDGDVSVTGGGSGTGVAAMINNEVDIAQSSRAMTEEEIEDAEANGADPHEFIVGQDGLAVAINNDNPVEDLTIQQIKDIFTGEITDWSDVGWDDGGDISVYSRQSNSGTYVFFNENVMDGEDFAAGAMFMPGSSAIREAIEQESNAIGYIGIGYVEGIDAVNVAEDEDSEYVTPFEEANIDDGTYPIARPLYFYVNGEPDGIIEDYLRWVLTSEEAADVRYDTGFYQVGPYESYNDETLSNLGLDW